MPVLMRYTIMLVTALSMTDMTVAADKALPPPVSGNDKDAVAAGSLEDSLEACLARIPIDATLGQKMLAEQTCRRAEADRAPVQTSGGR